MDLLDKFIHVAINEAITEDAAWYCWHASRNQAALEAIWNKYGAFMHQQIVWAKDRPILTRSWYMWQHEPCMFGWKKGHKPPRTAEDYPHTIWTFPTTQPGVSTVHPTSKPVELFAIPISQHLQPHEICYEPFCGSGTQLIAAQKLNRVCYAMELSEKYCEVICQRWEKYTGQKRKIVKNCEKPCTQEKSPS